MPNLLEQEESQQNNITMGQPSTQQQEASKGPVIRQNQHQASQQEEGSFEPAANTHQKNDEATPMEAPKCEDEWRLACDHFRRYGYIYFKDFFTPEQVDNINKWASEIASAASAVLQNVDANTTLETYLKAHPEAPIVVPEKSNPRQVCRAEDFVAPETFASFRNIPDMVRDVLHRLQSEEYCLFKEKINFKWPGGGAFPPHQDYPAYDFLQPHEHATAMLSVDRATIENGCLRVAHDWTGSLTNDSTFDAAKLQQGRAVVPYVKGGKNNGTILEAYSEKFDWKCLNTHPADLVIFSSFVPHYSEENRSDAARRAFFLTFNRSSEGDHHHAYYDKKRNDPNNPIFHIATPTAHNAQQQEGMMM